MHDSYITETSVKLLDYKYDVTDAVLKLKHYEDITRIADTVEAVFRCMVSKLECFNVKSHEEAIIFLKNNNVTLLNTDEDYVFNKFKDEVEDIINIKNSKHLIDAVLNKLNKV